MIVRPPPFHTPVQCIMTNPLDMSHSAIQFLPHMINVPIRPQKFTTELIKLISSTGILFSSFQFRKQYYSSQSAPLHTTTHHSHALNHFSPNNVRISPAILQNHLRLSSLTSF